MKILILEDDDQRIEQFTNNLSGDQMTVVIVKEAIHAINYLQNETWNVLFLDHDLGGKVNVSTNDKNTGSEVARYLNKNSKRKPKLIILHSFNVDGQKNMKSLIPEAVIYQSAWVKITRDILLDPQNIRELKKLAITQKERLDSYGHL